MYCCALQQWIPLDTGGAGERVAFVWAQLADSSRSFDIAHT